MDCIDHNRKGGKGGYTSIYKDGKMRLMHRVVYCETHSLPYEAIAGKVVRHKCDNSRCINPEHLELGTQADNMADMVSRGRSATGTMNGSAKLTLEQVVEIRRRYKPRCKVNGGRALAREFGCDQKTVSNIVNGKNWRT